MTQNPLALTFDFGTQSLRVALTNKKGEIVSIIKRKYDPTYYSEKKGYAEQDPDFYVINAKSALKELCKANKDKVSDIIGATITCFRDTSVQLDENLKPLRKSILWLDQRMAKAKERIPFIDWALFTLVGMKDTIKFNRSRTVAHWLKENEPETWSKCYKYVSISCYITYCLTGNLVDSAACVTGHYPLDFKHNCWLKPSAMKARIFGIPQRMLSDIKAPGEILGKIKDEIAEECGLPKGVILYASGSDKACETVGLGALNRDTGAVSYGTACTIEVSNQKYYEPETFLPAYPAAVPGWYNMDVQIYRGYWMLSWFAKNFAPELMDQAAAKANVVEELLNSKMSDVPPGCDGLVLQPYWGPGLSRPLSKGSIIGFSDVHTRTHLYRAIIEGIAYGLREGLESIEKHQHHKISSIRISGGGSQNDAICQITADIFGLPVSRVQTIEASTLGAATSIFLFAKVFDNVDEAINSMTHKTKTFEPNDLAHQQYEYLYKKVYLKMYPSLKKIYKDLNKYGKRY